MATVAGVNGIIILPDAYEGTEINTAHSAWGNNTISASDWAAYEANGAVFLPAAGSRSGTSVSDVGSSGFFWASTHSNTDSADGIGFRSDILTSNAGDYVNTGQPVRLVR